MSAGEYVPRKSRPADVADVEGPHLDYPAAWQSIQRERDGSAIFACRQLLQADDARSPETAALYLSWARESAREAERHDLRLEAMHERYRRQRDADDPAYWIGCRR